MLNYSANGPSGYNLTNSLRFRSSVSSYLNRTPASAGNRKTWTWSAWIKLGKPSDYYALFGSTNNCFIGYGQSTGGANLGIADSNTSTMNVQTTALFRDPSAWYHIVFALDTTQATASNRVKIYVNGVQQTSFVTATYPTQNADFNINNNTAQYLGRTWDGFQYFDGYMTEVNFIDGQALTPSSFGNTNAITGVWQPAKYTGTYGTNGFYLKFPLNTTSAYAGSFNGSSQYLSLANPTQLAYGTGDFTFESWVYFNSVSGTSFIYDARPAGTSGGAYTSVYQTNGVLYYAVNSINAITGQTLVAGVWYHIAVSRSGSSTKMFVNGAQTGSTYSDTTNYIVGTNRPVIGIDGNSVNSWINGYISNLRVIKGTALYTQNFTPPSSALTAVTNTQLLTLQSATIVDNSANALAITNNGSVAVVGGVEPFTYPLWTADYSGNANNWSFNNILTYYDGMRDVPTLTSATVANYAVANPLDKNTNVTVTNGNLTVSTAVTNAGIRGSMYVSSGKYYWEATCTTKTNYPIVGIANLAWDNTYVGSSSGSYGYANDGIKYNNGSTASYGASYTSGDIIGIALDLDAGTLVFYKNNVSQGTAYSSLSGTFAPAFSGQASDVWSLNFGQLPFTYTPPSGFVALNTFNLPTSTIVKGNTVMDATIYTGTGTTQTITNAAGFRPDLVWIKQRNGTQDHYWFDSIRGATVYLTSTSTNGDNTVSNTLTSFNSNGYSAGGNTATNGNTLTYVGWQWQAGQGSSSTNTAGSITSTVSVNTSAGFSVVTYTGASGTQTIGHGLGVAPKMIITKCRNANESWWTYHASLGHTQYLALNSTAAAGSLSWGGAPTSTVYYNNSPNFMTSGNTYVNYCWAEIAGFSRFGSYTGNGSTDGTFVYTGFLPKYILIKASSFSGLNSDWFIYDTARNTYNTPGNFLCADLSQAEASGVPIDCLSNGFKLRGTGSGTNSNGATYIFAAFASNPFKNSLAF